jgi:hypothetical protein
MPGNIAKAALILLALVTAASAQAQTWQPWGQSQPQPKPKAMHHRREHRETEPDAVAAPVIPDRRDSLVASVDGLNGRPYWLALAQCGGIYFKLNILYTDAAVRARVVKPDPKANAELTTKLHQAISTATAYFEGAEHFLVTDRGLERADAVLTYDGPSRAEGDRSKTIEAALAATRSCPALYQACQRAFPKQCSEPLAPAS